MKTILYKHHRSNNSYIIRLIKFTVNFIISCQKCYLIKINSQKYVEDSARDLISSLQNFSSLCQTHFS